MLADLTILNIISFLLIFFIGLPHGSFDGAVASLVGFSNRIQFLKFAQSHNPKWTIVIIIKIVSAIMGKFNQNKMTRKNKIR